MYQTELTPDQGPAPFLTKTHWRIKTADIIIQIVFLMYCRVGRRDLLSNDTVLLTAT